MKKTNKERRKSKLKIPGGENKREDRKSSKSDFIKHKKFKEKLQKFAHSRTTLIGLLILLIIVLLFTDFVALRMKLARQVDDVNLFIYCDNGIIEKSDMLMVIPLYKNVSIAENKGWCEWIVGLNKTLGMHGVYHTYKEFAEPRDEEYVLKGMEEFKKCFGFYPEIFEAPQLALSRENKRMLKEIGFEVRGYPFQLIHKVYHCSDTGMFSNKFIDRI